MRKIWDKIVEWLSKIPQDKQFHRNAGRMSAAFVAIVFLFKWPVAIAALFAILKDAWDEYCKKGSFDIKDVLWSIEGGMEIQIFVWLGLLVGLL